jgi:hypothetical protein
MYKKENIYLGRISNESRKGTSVTFYIVQNLQFSARKNIIAIFNTKK